MIRVQHFPERTVDIPWKIDHAPLPSFAHKNSRVMRRTRPHEALFHRQVRIRRNDSQWGREALAQSCYVKPGGAIKDPIRILESTQDLMIFAQGRSLFMTRGSVENGTF